MALTEDLGRTFSSGDRGWATSVSIRLDSKLDIAVQVVRGGLRVEPYREGLLEI